MRKDKGILNFTYTVKVHSAENLLFVFINNRVRIIMSFYIRGEEFYWSILNGEGYKNNRHCRSFYFRI